MTNSSPAATKVEGLWTLARAVTLTLVICAAVTFTCLAAAHLVPSMVAALSLGIMVMTGQALNGSGVIALNRRADRLDRRLENIENAIKRRQFDAYIASLGEADLPPDPFQDR
jgi:hypothetical protein